MKWTFFLILLGTPTIFTMAAEPENPTTLAAVLQKVMDRHPIVQAYKARKEVAQQGVSEQKSTFFPTLDLTLAMGDEWNNNATTRTRYEGNDLHKLLRQEGNLTLTERLFDGFDTLSRVRAAKERNQNAHYAVHTVGEKLAVRTIELYLNVLRQRALVQIAEESVRTHQDILSKIERREELGYDKKSDVYQAKSRLALSKTRMHAQKGGLEEATSSYFEVVGETPGNLEPPSFDAAWTYLSIEEAIETALKDNPNLQAAQANTSASRWDIHTAKAPFFPALNLELTGAEAENLSGVKGQDDSYFAALRLRYNLFKGGADQARKKKAVETYFQASAEETEEKRQLREEMRRTWSSIEVARAQMVEEKEHLKISEQLVEVYLKQFLIGTRPLLALLDAEDERASAKTNLKNYETKLLFEQFRLLSATGQVLKRLNVSLKLK
ncbi:MAG: TolC family outer membrane protein [Gammaproteobacteria bacterium]|nr:TolC family outer membrane protein [Gammaproteobacteria bacterium]